MMRFKGLLLGLALMGSAFAQTSPSGMTVEGTVYQVEPTAVYVMTPDTTAVKVPTYATFLIAGSPTAVTELRTGQKVTAQFPPEPIEVIAGPLPPTDDNPYFHRSIKRGAAVIEQDFRAGVWQDTTR